MNIPAIHFDQQFYTGNDYSTPQREIGLFPKTFTNTYFYFKALLGPVIGLGIAAHLDKCDDITWVLQSARMGRVFENVGCTFHINGMDTLKNINEPCVIVANHMSTLETFILPSVIRPHMPVTFVVKQSLTKIPLFGKILERRDAISVERKNPRQDLQHIMNEGKKRLDSGMSVVIFPQSTRSTTFNRAKFNSIGAKLAKHANRPIIPLALKTDAWAQGKIIKDFGAVHPDKIIRFAFGTPLHINGNGKEEHAQICEFISNTLDGWTKTNSI